MDIDEALILHLSYNIRRAVLDHRSGKDDKAAYLKRLRIEANSLLNICDSIEFHK